MSYDELANVEDFTVGHEKYGEIVWRGITDVNDLDLDVVVIFGESTLEVYPEENSKPPKGTQLNKPSQVTLKGCWPVDRATGKREPTSEPRALRKYEKRLRSVQKSMDNTTFREYDPTCGHWIFDVENF